MFSKVLIANRGEIACRILRTLDRMGIASVAVHSEPDADAAHVRRAHESVALGGATVAESYLRGDAILEAARKSGAQAIHPGYGLLSENADFASACAVAGISFIGPTPAQIRDFGLKHRARDLAIAAGVPICPGSPLLHSCEEALAAAAELGFPLMLKATAGGGGIGMRLCRNAEELAREIDSVQRLAAAHFGNADLFLERHVERARHVEVQIFGDGLGHVVTLGERDCSLQRRRQKVVEEAPAAEIDPGMRADLQRAAAELGRSVRYRSAGTVEFLVDTHANRFYFLEVNTRLQVEHCVTEEICGVDLVEWMIRTAAGDLGAVHSYWHDPRGHAIEVRLYAEDPLQDFQPSSGTLTAVHFPPDVRTESWIDAGVQVSPFYDPLLAKLVCWGESREQAIERMAAALQQTEVSGIETNLRYLRGIFDWDVFRSHAHHTTALADFVFQPPVVDVVQPGNLTTVQDYPGRLGYWDVGVPPSGPMDWLSFRLANRIVGNPEGVAGLEITVSGPTLRFRTDAIVCAGGAAIEARLDDAPIDMWQPVSVKAGSTLVLGAVGNLGARSYLAVRGGFAVPEYLGSRSTFTLGGFGGHCGRPVRAGDRLPLGTDAALEPSLSGLAASRLAPEIVREWRLRVIDGPHSNPEFFTDSDIESFYTEGFEVHYQSARTGVRLIGPKPAWARRDGGEAGLHPSNIHDTAYSVGSIDYTGDMPVILGPDGPSLGGFVCPAVVIHADRWKLGQLRPGDRVFFRAVTPDEAVLLAREQDEWIASRGAVPCAAVEGIAAPRANGVVENTPVRQPQVTYRLSGDRHLLVEYGPMALDIHLRVRVQLLLGELQRRREEGECGGLIDLTPGVRSLQIHYDPARMNRHRLLRLLEETEEHLPAGNDVSLPTRIVHLPLSWDDPATREAIDKYMRVVRDDAPWCPSNIEFIRRINGLDSHDDVRRIVFDASYLVLGLGDVYLGAPVATPVDPRHRLVTTKYNPARTWTPENAVGIGGAYMCIYGMEGPGGYQFVGRTVPVWNTYRRWRAETPWLLRFFDQIRFFPVTAAELLEYRAGVRAGRIDIEIQEGRFDLAAHDRFLQSIAPSADEFRRHQRAAFDAERQRWQEAGEFEAVKRLTEESAATLSAEESFELPAGCTVVPAPLGAQVWRLSVREGELVDAGQEVCVLAAMKMETPVLAPSAGRVERILCREGEVVQPGANLLILREV